MAAQKPKQQPQQAQQAALQRSEDGGGSQGAAESEGELAEGQGEEEEHEEDGIEFRGVMPRGRGEGERWVASIAVTLNKEECPVVEGKGGKKHHGQSVCECPTQAEAAAARDLALLWREQRLGFLKGDLTWQPEEYNFDVMGYHARVDITPSLPKALTLGDLRALLARLCQAGTLAELAAELERNPLSLAVQRPPLEPYSEATMQAVRQRYQYVQYSTEAKTPWRASVPLPRKAQQQGGKKRDGPPLVTTVIGTYHTSAQAAAAADMAVAWRELHVEGGDLEGQRYNFPLHGYEENELVWEKLMAAEDERDVRCLLRKVRDCGRLQAIAQRQLEAADAAAAAAAAAGRDAATAAMPGQVQGLGQGGKKRGRPSSGGAKPAGGGGQASPGGGKRKKGTSGMPSGPAALAAADAAGAGVKQESTAEEAPDPLPVLAALTDATGSEAAAAAGLTLELTATYVIALQSKAREFQRWELGTLRMWLEQRRWSGIVSLMKAALQKADLEVVGGRSVGSGGQ